MGPVDTKDDLRAQGFCYSQPSAGTTPQVTDRSGAKKTENIGQNFCGRPSGSISLPCVKALAVKLFQFWCVAG